MAMLCSRYTRTSSPARSSSNARICASMPKPPTFAISSSSGMTRPSTVRVACRKEARISPPESIRVPSRSKRTVSQRIPPDPSRGRTCPARNPRPRRPSGASIPHALQVEPPRRRGRARLRAGPALEQAGEVGRLPLEHRANERPHHVTEEAVGRDRQRQHVAVALPGARGDNANEDLVLRLGRREGPEVVLADDESGRLGEPLLVERPRGPEG